MAAAETWSGRAGFILAAIGSAVGLGSIWKFPWLTPRGGAALHWLLRWVTPALIAAVAAAPAFAG